MNAINYTSSSSGDFRIFSDTNSPPDALFTPSDAPDFGSAATQFVFTPGSGDNGTFGQGNLFLTITSPTDASGAPNPVTLTDGSLPGHSTLFTMSNVGVSAPNFDLYLCAFQATINLATLPSGNTNNAPECSLFNPGDLTTQPTILSGVTNGSTTSSAVPSTTLKAPSSTTKLTASLQTTTSKLVTTSTPSLPPVAPVSTAIPTPSLLSYVINAGTGNLGNINSAAAILPGQNGAAVVNLLANGAIFVPASGLYLALNLVQGGQALFQPSLPSGLTQLLVTVGALAKRQLSGTLTIRNANGAIVNAYSCPSTNANPTLSFSTAMTLVGCTTINLTITQVSGNGAGNAGAVVVNNNICINVSGVHICNNQTLSSVGGPVNFDSSTHIIIGCTIAGNCNQVSSLQAVCVGCAAYHCTGTNGAVALAPANAAASSAFASASASGSSANASASSNGENAVANASASSSNGSSANAVANASASSGGSANAVANAPAPAGFSSTNSTAKANPVSGFASLPHLNAAASVLPVSSVAVAKANSSAIRFTGDAVSSRVKYPAGFLTFVGAFLILA
ncbi:hypothetical protein NEOLI_005042 [Neolecta irregularis DAH-3]|uniref:Uncharacterized protein n=1 Tax=Neolecta irregularis (strain DAH-3) TaxID=1198029 RepID=A0A1U7LGX2_NEOID|nr:hypothetical protein NEOLI_005042 [Neolecta irregularis DAH-3]|eukprot:OLL21897.1 hypothetical protein NEOLI_005042 [Neolecta irregularis DAH-3]